MAVSKLWPVTVRLATVLDYASNPEKTTKPKSKYSNADYQALRDVVAYAKADKEADRAEPALSKEKSKTPEPNRQTVHTQPKKHKKSKER